MRELEKTGLDPKSRWYIKEGNTPSEKWKTRGVPFSSFRERYKRVLSVAFPFELNTLGKSYVHAYGMSRDVHFTPHDTSSGFNEAEIFRGVDRLGLLILALVIRVQHLLGCVPDGINKTYRELHDNNKGPSELAQSLKTKTAEVGDIIWTHGYFAEVLQVTISKYGYPAYHVNFIESQPLHAVPDDWVAGFEIKLVATKTFIDNAVDQLLVENKHASGKQEDRAALLDMAKRAAIRLSAYKLDILAQSQNSPG